MNKTDDDLAVELRLLSANAEIKMIGNLTEVKAQTMGESVFFIMFDKNEIQQAETIIEIGIYSGDQLIDKIKSTFIGPNK